MVSSYQKKNLCGVALAAVVFGLTIACLANSWFSYSTTFNSVTVSASGSSANTYAVLNSSKLFYDLDGIRSESKPSGQNIATTTRTEYSRTAMPKVYATVKLAQAFVLIGLILSFIVAVILLIFVFDPIRNKVIFSFGMSLTDALAQIRVARFILHQPARDVLPPAAVVAASIQQCNRYFWARHHGHHALECPRDAHTHLVHL